MPTLKDNPTILALETAIGGGSISVYRNGSEVGFIAGDNSVSRSEELLPNIKTLLAQSDIEPTDIDMIAVSRGPGSFTGIRIGLSTALGLSRSLNIPCIGAPLFDAIAASHRNYFPLAVILPMGKNEVVWKAFSDTPSTDSTDNGSVCSIEEILPMVNSTTTILIHESLLPMFADSTTDDRIISLGYDLAKFVACDTDRWSNQIDLSPIYIQNPAKRSNLF